MFIVHMCFHEEGDTFPSQGRIQEGERGGRGRPSSKDWHGKQKD